MFDIKDGMIRLDFFFFKDHFTGYMEDEVGDTLDTETTRSFKIFAVD